MSKSVKPSADDVEYAKKLAENPEMILRLVDLLFLGQDSGTVIPS